MSKITPNPASTLAGLRLVDGNDISSLVAANNNQAVAASAEAITAITTVGAGTLTAAGIAGGVIKRTGSTAAFTDTTATAALIIGAQNQPTIGQSWEFTYYNNTVATATITGGTGVTVSGQTLVPANSWVTYLVTVTSATAVTMVAIGAGALSPRQPVSLTTLGSGVTTGSLPALAIVGPAIRTILKSAATTPGAQLVRTAAQMLADSGCNVGDTLEFRIVQTGAGTLTLTADGGATVTLTGTMTVAQNTWRDFVITWPTATTATITEVGTGTDS